MDRETHPNAVYKYDAHTQTIYPVDKQTNQPLSEISKLVMSKQKQQQNIPNKGMIRNVRRTLAIEKLDTNTPTPKFISYSPTGEPTTKERSRYFADFVIDVFVVPDETETVEDVGAKLDNWLTIVDITSTGFSSDTLLEKITNPKKVFSLNKDDKSKPYFNDTGSYFQYVEKIPGETLEEDIWVIHPDFQTFRLPFTIYRDNGVEEQTHLVHLHMKFNVKILNRVQAYTDIRENTYMSNFYVLLVNDRKLDGSAGPHSETESRNLFATNLIVMSSDQLQGRGEILFIHEIGHSLFKYDDLSNISPASVYGTHNQTDDESYMSGSSVTIDRQFTGIDLMAFTLLNKNKTYYETHNFVNTRTYGEVIDEVYASDTAARRAQRKQQIINFMLYTTVIPVSRTKAILSNSYQTKKQYLLNVLENKDLFAFKMWIEEEKTIQPLRININENDILQVYNIKLSEEVNCQGWGIYNEFVFYNKLVDDLVARNIQSFEDFITKNPKDTWPTPPNRIK